MDMIKVSVYLDKGLINDYADIIETAENPKLRKIINDDQFSKYPYFQVCQFLFEEIRRKKKRSSSEIEHLNFVIRSKMEKLIY